MIAGSLLIFYGALTGSYKANIKRSLLLGGIFFSMAGDFMMMFVGHSDAFMKIGVLLYLIVIFLYTTVFTIDALKIKPLDHYWYQLAFAVLILVFGVEFYIINYPDFGIFRMVILLFNVGLVLMGMMAAFRSINKDMRSYIVVLVGSLCFILSYALLAIDHFVLKIQTSSFLILTTYMIAQYMIVNGMMREFLKQLVPDQKN